MESESSLQREERRQGPDLLTVGEVARRLKLSVKTVRRLERTGRLPARRYGRCVRFEPGEVLAAGRSAV